MPFQNFLGMYIGSSSKYSLYCKICLLHLGKGTYIGETKGDNTRLQFGINQHISDCKTGDSTCKFPRHVYDCGIKNNCLEEPFFSLNIMLRLNKNNRLETIEKHFHIVKEITHYRTLLKDHTINIRKVESHYRRKHFKFI